MTQTDDAAPWRARAVYLGEADDHSDDLAPEVAACADHVVAEIRRLPG